MLVTSLASSCGSRLLLSESHSGTIHPFMVYGTGSSLNIGLGKATVARARHRLDHLARPASKRSSGGRSTRNLIFGFRRGCPQARVRASMAAGFYESTT